MNDFYDLSVRTFEPFPETARQKILAFFKQNQDHAVLLGSDLPRFQFLLSPSLYAIQNAEQFYRRASLEFFPVPKMMEDRAVLAEGTSFYPETVFLRFDDGSVWYQRARREAICIANGFRDMIAQMKANGRCYTAAAEGDRPHDPFPDPLIETVHRCFCHENPDEILPFFTAPFFWGGTFQEYWPFHEEDAKESFLCCRDILLDFPAEPFDFSRYRLPPSVAGDWLLIGKILSGCQTESLLLVHPTLDQYATFYYSNNLFFHETYPQYLRRTILPNTVIPGDAVMSMGGSFSQLLEDVEQHGWAQEERVRETRPADTPPKPHVSIPVSIAHCVTLNAVFVLLIAIGITAARELSLPCFRSWGDNQWGLLGAILWFASWIPTIVLYQWIDRPRKIPVQIK